MIKNTWAMLMDSGQNPLMKLPKTVRFQIMIILSIMWSSIFCISAGLMVWYPEFVLTHMVLLLLGIFGTGTVFILFDNDRKTRIGV